MYNMYVDRISRRIVSSRWLLLFDWVQFPGGCTLFIERHDYVCSCTERFFFPSFELVIPNVRVATMSIKMCAENSPS